MTTGKGPEFQPDGRAPNVIGDPRFLIVKGTRRQPGSDLPTEVVERLKQRFKPAEPEQPFWDGKGGV